MAQITSHIHLRDDDQIVVERGERLRWIKLGGDCAVFATDDQFRALRSAIDAYLGAGAPKAEAA